jgi:formate hydrogenlyase subunit 6/NADH:ubiquinone oxidoreductase subunit I
MQIYYFSGTGNSLHVARELKRRMPETTLVPIINALSSSKIETKAETIGLVFPIHAFTIPFPVKQFLQRVDLKSAAYIFAVATRFCSDKVFSDINKILAKKEKSLASYFSVEMPCTYIPIFKLPPQKEIMRMESELQRRLDQIQTIVSNKQISCEKDDLLVFLLGHILYPPITSWFQRIRFPNMEKSFYVDSKCTGCGLCESVCLSEKIRMKNNEPEWVDATSCTYCFACLHYCPVQAIQIKGRKTITRGRYHHSEVNAENIAGQKH